MWLGVVVRLTVKPLPYTCAAEDPVTNSGPIEIEDDRGRLTSTLRSLMPGRDRGVRFMNRPGVNWCACVAGSRGAMDDDGLVKISRPVNGSCYTIQDRRRIHITSSASRQRDSFLLSIQVQCVQSSVQVCPTQDNPISR